MSSHQGDNRHAFLEEDDNNELISVRIDLPLLISCIRPRDQLINVSPPPPSFYLTSYLRLTEEELNN